MYWGEGYRVDTVSMFETRKSAKFYAETLFDPIKKSNITIKELT